MSKKDARVFAVELCLKKAQSNINQAFKILETLNGAPELKKSRVFTKEQLKLLFDQPLAFAAKYGYSQVDLDWIDKIVSEFDYSRAQGFETSGKAQEHFSHMALASILDSSYAAKMAEFAYPLQRGL